MALVAVAYCGGVIPDSDPLCFGALRNEAHVLRLENVVASVKYFRAILGSFQQIAKRRYRSVVQVGCSGPDCVQRDRYITVCRTEITEFPWITFSVRVIGVGGLFSPDLDTMRIGADFGDWNDLTGAITAKGMTGRAITLKDRLTRRR